MTLTAGTIKRKPPTIAGILQKFLYWLYLTFFRPSIKWVIHLATDTCEIERIVRQAERGSWAPVVIQFERSLLLSRSPDLRHLSQVPIDSIEDAQLVIVRQKAISRQHLMKIQRPLNACLRSLLGYGSLIVEVEQRRSEKYNVANSKHENKLLRLWSLLDATPCPGVRGKHWQILGFQGDDPSTDFRGMGVLGLDQLIYLCVAHRDTARSLFQTAQHPTIGFPFAIAAISMTALTRDLLRQGHLKTHLWNTCADEPMIDDFHQCYYQIFTLFITVWKNSEAKSVMEFDRRKLNFADDMINFLSDEHARLPTTPVLIDI